MRRLTFLTAAMFVCVGLFGQQYDAETMAKMRAEKEALALQQPKINKQQKVKASKNDILMQTGTVTTCSANFYDTGGSAGGYQNNENYTLTLLPATEGAKIMVTFTAYNTESGYDYLKIYDGTSASATQLANLHGTAVPSEPYIASNAQGALTFVFTSDGSVVRAGWAATVACYTQVENNLAAMALMGTPFATEGEAKTMEVTVKNMGTATIAADAYTVTLVDAADAVLATANGVALASNEVANIELVWTPATAGTIVVNGVVNFAADQDMSNNETAAMEIEVMSSGVYVAQIGSAETFPPSRVPFDYYFKNSASQTLYTPTQLGIGGGLITALAYENNFATATVGSKPVKIWIGETTATDMTAGWVDPASLTLVYDGEINTPGGRNVIAIPLQTPYVYQGGNLVIYTYRVWENQYYTNNDKFYGTEIAASNCTRRLASDTQFDPATPGAGTVISWVPNTTIFFSTEGLGALEGTVTSEGAPVEGVKVQIVGAYANTYTNAAGMYSFPYLMADIYELEFSKHGYDNAGATNVTVVGNETTVVDVTMTPIMTYMVSGTVTASDTQLGVEGAVVTFEGYADYMATTDANGHYSIEGVYGGGREYAVTAEYEGYTTYTGTVTVNNANIADLDIIVEEIAYPAKNVTAALDGENVLVTWKNPNAAASGTPRMLMWDNGENNNAIGTGGVAEFDVAHRYSPEVLQELEVGGMSITQVTFWPNEAAATYTVKIWTGGTAAAPATLAYEQAVAAPTIGAWNEITLTTPFEIDDTQELWIGYNVNTTTGYPAGTDAGPQVEGWGNMMYFQGTWTTLYQLAPTLTYNWNIHAWVDNAKALDMKLSRIAAEHRTSAPKVILENGKSRGLDVNFGSAREFGQYTVAQNSVENDAKVMLNYSVYRLLEGQEMDDWTEMAAATTDTFFVDNTWSGVAPGLYQYAVVANYTNDVTANPAFSNILANAMEVEYVVNITTNAGDPATGAIVSLVNQDGVAEHAYTMTAGATGATFPAVWRGTYNLTITLQGFGTYSANDLVIDDEGLSHTAELIETIMEPFGLAVAQVGMDAHFSWNNATGFTDDIESYESFLVADIGDYTMVDVDGSATYTITNTTFPNQAYVGSYIVFDPAATTPALSNAAWQAHSGAKYLACFAGTTPPNNDWIMTPEVTVTPGMVFSFWAKSVTDQYGLERFNVGVSTGGTTPSDFTIISGSTFVQAPIEWTQFSYPLTAYTGQTIRLAIQCVSNDAFVFMLDDIILGQPKATDRAFNGYTVYLDGVQEAAGIMETNYIFEDLEIGEYEAGVKAVYSTGESAIVTTPFPIVLPTYTVTFQVKRASNNAAIANANIVINGESLTTNTQGVATIVLPAGTYDYVVTKTGFNMINDQVEVVDANITETVLMTGIEETIAAQNVVLYPNPVAEMLTIVRANTSSAMVEIFADNGSMVKAFEMNEAQKEISVSDLNSGVYFVRIIENQNATVQRFIKK